MKYGTNFRHNVYFVQEFSNLLKHKLVFKAKFAKQSINLFLAKKKSKFVFNAQF